jgi:hypothetical protein
MHFTRPNIFESVENLTIEHGSIDNWSGSFPRVKRVKISQIYFGSSDGLMEAENCGKIEHLEVNYGKVCELNLKTLKELNLRFIRGFHGCPIKAENVKNLDEILIEKCNDCEWLIECLENDDLKMKRLKIKETPVSDELKVILNKNVMKIDEIEIV